MCNISSLKRQHHPVPLSKWQKIFFVQATTHGAAWSLGPVLLLPTAAAFCPPFLSAPIVRQCRFGQYSSKTVSCHARIYRRQSAASCRCDMLSGDSKELMLILILLASSMAFIAVGYYSNQSARTIYETQFQLRGTQIHRRTRLSPSTRGRSIRLESAGRTNAGLDKSRSAGAGIK
jgi:hypothetical protein